MHGVIKLFQKVYEMVYFDDKQKKLITENNSNVE